MTASDATASSTSTTGSGIAGPILGPPQATPTDTARRWLMSVLAATLAFVVLGSFGYAVYASTDVMSWLQVVLPVVSGLVGAAGGFYFGQASK
jgi:hypothetical protein